MSPELARLIPLKRSADVIRFIASQRIPNIKRETGDDKPRH
jgi:hypothetical protein